MSNEITLLQVYKGAHYDKKLTKKNQKIIVFDLDETIGSFGELYALWSGINKIAQIDKNSEKHVFHSMMDIYPEFLRYGILNILDYIYQKKLSGECDKLFIYTNNVCQPPWVSLIIEYINDKLKINGTLFDKIISAFKINNKIVELGRTQREKTCADLIRCTLLPKTTEICFIDDTYHRDMINEQVYYIKPLPYHHGLSNDVIIRRFIDSEYGSRFINISNMKDSFCEFMTDWFYFHNNDYFNEKKIGDSDILVSKKLMFHIKDFFYLTNRKSRTCKKRSRIGRSTRKNRYH